MFEAHFGLTATPFAREIPVEQLFVSQAHREALARLHYVAERRRVMVLTGEVGAGKSTALRRLKAELDATRYEVVYLADVAFTPRSFFQGLLDALRLDAPHALPKLKKLAREALAERWRTQHRTPVLLVDEAQFASPLMLEEIRGLLNYECDAFAPFALVLCGTRALAERLALRSAEALAQRIDLRYHLGGFSPQETAGYIRHHLKLAGADQEPFTAKALDHIHRACNGLPRPINQLAHLCLMAAAARQERVVDHELVEAVMATEWQAPQAAGR